MSVPYERKYTIGTCFLCQQCLYCENKLSFITCQCDLNKKPITNIKKKKRKVYSRVYNPQTKHTVYNKLQIEKLEEANNTYSYDIDFSSKFSFSLCAVCHNTMTRLKRKLSNTNTTSLKTSKSNSRSKDKSKSLITTEKSIIKEVVYEISSDDDDKKKASEGAEEVPEELNNKEDSSMEEPFEDTITADEETGTEIDDDLGIKESKEISFKLIIKQERECSAAKWEAINQTTFRNFQKELNLLIQTQLDKWLGYDDYIVSYKLGKEAGSGTQLTDKRDWDKFLTEYHKFNSKKKEVVIFASIKSQKNNPKVDKKR